MKKALMLRSFMVYYILDKDGAPRAYKLTNCTVTAALRTMNDVLRYYSLEHHEFLKKKRIE
jgi:hypothetical protein